jgi:TolA-binding protein
MRFAFIFFALTSLQSFSQDFESAESDILFLKIQELEQEIAELRNELETQAYLLEKLLNELESLEDESDGSASEEIIDEDIFRFEGINDSQSIDEVYNSAINALENDDLENAKKLLDYFLINFPDAERIPLVLFWLGEISYIEGDIENSFRYFLELVSNYKDHWRAPQSHKRLGDIYLSKDDIDNAKAKYNFVLKNYPNNSVSSIVLQILENME